MNKKELADSVVHRLGVSVDNDDIISECPTCGAEVGTLRLYLGWLRDSRPGIVKGSPTIFHTGQTYCGDEYASDYNMKNGADCIAMDTPVDNAMTTFAGIMRNVGGPIDRLDIFNLLLFSMAIGRHQIALERLEQ